METRLNKYLSQTGVVSRREADRLISAGRVRVNGELIRTLGSKIKVGQDRVEVDGTLVEPAQSRVYIMLNKPPGYLVTKKDPHNRPTVMALVSPAGGTVYPVGRLDMNSEGLLIMTNDGELAHRLMHPRYGVRKEYEVTVKGHPLSRSLKKLEEGILLDGKKTAPAEVKMVSSGPNASRLKVVIHEGRKREIRLMMEQIGHKVLQLKRVRYAGISLGSLKTGKWRSLKQEEIHLLRRLVGL